MTKNKALSPPTGLKLLTKRLDTSRALRESQFVPFFQPIVRLRTGQLSGFEVLARWQHPTEGLIPPTAFIGIAEQDGWIGELTRQIVQKAFAAADLLPAPLNLAINISPLQLTDISLPEQIRTLAIKAGFPLSRVVIEITESALIDNSASACAIASEFKKMGCRLALDDFGTGYSSLSHLQALPFDKLKIDQSFVGSMTEKRESRKIVAAVVGLGQSLALTTVAEGIETQEQAEMMLWLGCDLGQGYFYGRPIPVEDLPACVSERREKLQITQGSAWKKISASNLDSSPALRLAQLQAVYDGAPVGLAFLDQNLRYVNLNQRLADMNGAGIEDHLGSPMAELIPDLFPHVEPFIRRALNGETVTDIEAQIPDTGETRLYSCQPVSDEGSEVVGVSLAVSDITDRKRSEEALRRSEAHYRSMVDLNPQVLWIMDPRGHNLDVSPRWDKETGLLKSQATDHEWLRSVHPEDIQPTVRAIAEARRTGSPIDVEYRVSNGKEGVCWKRSRGAPRFDASGNIICWYGSVEDIDGHIEERKLVRQIELPEGDEAGIQVDSFSPTSTEAARRNQALRDLAILDTPPEAEFDDLVMLASEICETPISLISLIDAERQWFKAAVGLAVSETSITSAFCAYTIAHQGCFIVADALQDERFKQNPLVLGAPHIRFYAGLPVYTGDGVAIGTLCVIDTVARILSPRQVRALTILSHQVQARIELRSERRTQLIEIESRQELTKRLEVSNEILREANQRLEQIQLQHMADETELRKRSELDALKNEYVAMVSHELRSPLTSVRGAVGILSGGLVGPATDKGSKMFRIALTNLDRMIRLVDDVLNLERIASGTALLQIQRCSLQDLVQQAVDTMVPAAQETGIKLNVTETSHAKYDEPTFNGDPDKTLQVLINLLSNALKFSPPGAEILVETRISADQLTLRISDEGRGIPEDQLGKIFERFRQVEQDDARRLGGTGLGLAICRAIVEQHGGAIWAERNAVKGTSFYVNLPRSPQGLSSDGVVGGEHLPLATQSYLQPLAETSVA